LTVVEIVTRKVDSFTSEETSKITILAVTRAQKILEVGVILVVGVVTIVVFGVVEGAAAI
jgi:hypothetical protein